MIDSLSDILQTVYGGELIKSAHNHNEFFLLLNTSQEIHLSTLQAQTDNFYQSYYLSRLSNRYFPDLYHSNVPTHHSLGLFTNLEDTPTAAKRTINLSVRLILSQDNKSLAGTIQEIPKIVFPS